MMRPNDDTNDRIQKTYIHNKTDKTEGNNRIDRIRRYATRLIRLKETIELTEDTNDTQMNQSYNYANQIQRCYILFRFCSVFAGGWFTSRIRTNDTPCQPESPTPIA